MKKGISLIILVITIILIIIIIATVFLALNNYSIIDVANGAKFANNLDATRQKLENYIVKKKVNNDNYERANLNWGGITKYAIYSEENNIGTDILIDDIFEKNGVPSNLTDKIAIKFGELVVKNVTDKELLIAQNMGIQHFELDVGSEDDEIEEEECKINYVEGSIMNEGITCNVDSTGIVTINGTARQKMFIRISDGVTVSSTGELQNWIKETQNNPIANPGEKITQKISVLAGTVKNADINVALRDETNVARANCMILKDILSESYLANEKLCFNYIFVQEGAVCDNLKIKVVVKKVTDVSSKNISTNITTGEIKYNDFNCKINNDGTITLNGSPGKTLYIKLSDGIEYTQGTGFTNMDWLKKGNVIAKKGTDLRLGINEISGKVKATQFNCLLRYRDSNTFAINCKLVDNIRVQTQKLTEDVNVLYLYVSSDAVFENYTIKPYIQALTKIKKEIN